jgi:formylglycine-generating enzyme required for sulfatase activity/predicted Ser/Thr protein kinase
MPATAIPEQIDGYRILKELGRGGMGIVYLAEDPTTKRPVALKVILQEIAQNANSRQRFLREARAMQSVKSDHIVQFHKVGEDQDRPYFVMEFLKGQTLETYLESGKELSVSSIVRIALEVAQGLADAHAQGLIHRDIKPENLFLEAPKGRIKILDFGLAREVDQGGQLTRTGGVMGTPYYMSPEQAEGKKELDHRADIFSFGVVLYRLCTNELPFQGDTVFSIIASLLQHEPPPVEELNARIPRRLCALIESMINRNRHERPQSMDEVLEELQRIRASLSAGILELTPVDSKITPFDSPALETKSQSKLRTRRSDHVPAKKKKKKIPWPLYGILGTAVVAIVILLIVTFGGNKDPKVVEIGLGKTEDSKKLIEPDPKRDNASKVNLLPDDPNLKPLIIPSSLVRLTPTFTPEQAKTAQEAWAKHLKREVIEKIDLGKNIRMEMVLLPPGSYLMGAADGEPGAVITEEQPQRTIQIDYPFYIGRFEVTQQEYKQLLGSNPSSFQQEKKERLPVEEVSWKYAKDFCSKLPKQTWFKGHWRLPSEAEWEYACRAGTQTSFSFGNQLNGEQANCDGNFPHGTTDKGRYLNSPQEVGKYAPNAFGLYDMHGNVAEWCEDYFGNYGKAPEDGSPQLVKQEEDAQVLRGGYWQGPANVCRSAARNRIESTFHNNIYGFRVVFVPEIAK